jgi:aspartyl-tRNA(Asn)/glutamyl-tRNA(Gln) amidotransferase subunit C
MSSTKTLTNDDVIHLAQLAKLSLTDEELTKISSQLDETIEKVKNLEELDTKHTEPTNSVVNLTNVFFEDGTENQKGLTQKQALSQAKKAEKGQFVVDKIL